MTLNFSSIKEDIATWAHAWLNILHSEDKKIHAMTKSTSKSYKASLYASSLIGILLTNVLKSNGQDLGMNLGLTLYAAILMPAFVFGGSYLLHYLIRYFDKIQSIELSRQTILNYLIALMPLFCIQSFVGMVTFALSPIIMLFSAWLLYLFLKQEAKLNNKSSIKILICIYTIPSLIFIVSLLTFIALYLFQATLLAPML